MNTDNCLYVIEPSSITFEEVVSMPKEAALQVRMDEDLKEQAEQLYKSLGTSFAEAVRIFAKQSVLESAMPFTIHLPEKKTSQRIVWRKGNLLFRMI